MLKTHKKHIKYKQFINKITKKTFQPVEGFFAFIIYDLLYPLIQSAFIYLCNFAFLD